MIPESLGDGIRSFSYVVPAGTQDILDTLPSIEMLGLDMLSPPGREHQQERKQQHRLESVVMKLPKDQSDATRAVHAGEDRHGQAGPLTTPITQASVFAVPGLKELREYADGKRDVYLYSRYGNPTLTAAEQKLAALERAEAAVVTSSGMAAELVAALITCRAGDEIVSMLDVYGGTVKMFEQVLSRCGIKTHFVPFGDLHNMERYFTSKTRMLFVESPTNPTLRCADIVALSQAARRRNIVVVADNTFATPILQKPLAMGADIVVHSATKYLGGHSDLTAGVLAGSKRWMDDARQMMILTGGCADPGCTYLLIRGLKTLDIRVQRACENAVQIAKALHKNKKVQHVYYPAYSEPATLELARRQMKAFGMMVSFDIRGGQKAAERFIDRLKLWYLATSLGGVESTVSYPLLSSHIGLGATQLRQLGVSDATIRLSVGIEDAADLIADLEQALAKA
jgi:cystathionine beta-lyase/cystathionine gamma-synthase